VTSNNLQESCRSNQDGWEEFHRRCSRRTTAVVVGNPNAVRVPAVVFSAADHLAIADDAALLKVSVILPRYAFPIQIYDYPKRSEAMGLYVPRRKELYAFPIPRDHCLRHHRRQLKQQTSTNGQCESINGFPGKSPSKARGFNSFSWSSNSYYTKRHYEVCRPRIDWVFFLALQLVLGEPMIRSARQRKTS